jgi:hypothetical protein
MRVAQGAYMNRKSEILKMLISELSAEQMGEVFFIFKNYGYEIRGNDPVMGRSTDQMMSTAIEKNQRTELRLLIAEIVRVRMH